MILIVFILGGVLGFLLCATLSSGKLERGYCIRTIYWLLTEIDSGRKDIDEVKKAIEEGIFEL